MIHKSITQEQWLCRKSDAVLTGWLIGSDSEENSSLCSARKSGPTDMFENNSRIICVDLGRALYLHRLQIWRGETSGRVGHRNEGLMRFDTARAHLERLL